MSIILIVAGIGWISTVTKWFPGDRINRELESANHRLSVAKQKQESTKRVHDDWIKSRQNFNNSRMAVNTRLESQKEGIQYKINLCKNYLNLGKDKIAEYWFALKCKEFGVEQPLNQLVVELREIVYKI